MRSDSRINIRQFDLEQDFQAALNVWREVGWLESAKPEENEGIKHMFEASEFLVGEVDSRLEATTGFIPAGLNYLGRELSLHALTGVVVSPLARKQGLAGRLVANSLQQGALRGDALSALLMFEQGYYNHLGYGTGSYEHIFTFDPAHLKVSCKPAIPERLTAEDWEAIHQSWLKRRKAHGFATPGHPGIIRDTLSWKKEKSYGLGYRNASKEITHMMWLVREKGSHGPLDVAFLTYRNYEQFLELLALLKNQADQVFAVKLKEPAGIQLRDLIKLPHKQSEVTRGSDYKYQSRAEAYWQVRALDLKKCLQAASLPGPEISFNLELSDPVEKYLKPADEWQGLAGRYAVTLGQNSSIAEGFKEGLPVMECTVNAFSRLWLGVLSPASLSRTDELAAPAVLLQGLGRLLALLPRPQLDWEF